jgi:hypothetical protein
MVFFLTRTSGMDSRKEGIGGPRSSPKTAGLTSKKETK